MRVLVFLAVATVAVGAFGQASRPTTAPIRTAAALKDDRTKAVAVLQDARAASIKRFDMSAGRTLLADMESKQKILEDARASGTPQDRLDASSAFVSAKASLDKSRVEFAKADVGVQRAELAIADIDRQMPQAEAADREEAKRLEELAAADRAKKLIDDAPELTVRMLETIGERYKGKIVKMTGIIFLGTDTNETRLLPGNSSSIRDFQAAEVDPSRIAVTGPGTEESFYSPSKWLDIRIEDSDRQSTSFVFAEKKNWADLIVKLRRGARITVVGKVVPLTHEGWYGITCTSVIVGSKQLIPPRTGSGN